MQDLQSILDLNEARFAPERDFFLKQTDKDKDTQERLQDRIRNLEQQIIDEKAYAFDLFIKEEVEKSCAKALVRYSLVAERMELNTSRVEEENSEGNIAETNSTSHQGNFRELYQDLIQ